MTVTVFNSQDRDSRNGMGSFCLVSVRKKKCFRKYTEYIKTQEDDCLLRIESITSSFKALLCELMNVACLDANAAVSPGALKRSAELLASAVDVVRTGLNDFSNFLQVKALRNFTLGSYPF